MTKATFNPRDHFGYSIGKGLFSNMKQASIFGRSNVLAGDVITDVTTIPGLVTYVFPNNNGQAMEIVSDNAADTDVVYLIEGLDANFDEIQEVVTVNGTTPVTLVNEYARVNNIGNVGTKANAGRVSVQDVGGGNTYSAASARSQESNVGVYTVPRGYEASILQVIQSMQKASGTDDDLTVGIKYRLDRTDSGTPNGVFRIPFDSGVQRSGDSASEFFNLLPAPLLGPCDIKLFATADTGGSIAAVRAALLLAKITESP
jgi:hypothetical protein